MYKEIIVNSTLYETRIALCEDQQLVELWVERAEKLRMVGDIYKGKVEAVLPGMQAAFVNIGLERSAFLHVSDLAPIVLDDDLDDEESKKTSSSKYNKNIPIQNLLKKGQEILIQIIKEPIRGKGPRVTSQLSIAGRYLVLMPTEEQIGISRKIEDRTERRRLKTIIQNLKISGMGLIVRTVGKGKDEKQFQNDAQQLYNLWEEIKNRSEKVVAPALIHRDMGLVVGVIRDIFTLDIDNLIIDNKYAFQEIKAYLDINSPNLSNRIQLYDAETPIFDAYRIEQEISKTLELKIRINKKGAYIVIDHTEAMVTIDVNTGGYTGKRDQAETILQTNLSAAKEIARQLRLRDIGGIIVIDFIDMKTENHRQAVYKTLTKELKRDRSNTKTFGISELGLVEMTRKRVRPSLIYTLSDPCPTCKGTGRILSPITLAMRIERWCKRAGINISYHKITLYVHPRVAKYLNNKEGHELFILIRKKYGIELTLKEQSKLHYDEFRMHDTKTNENLTRRFTEV